MASDDPLARKRLALDVMLRRAELRTAREQLRVAEAQLEAQRREPRGGLAFLLSPTGVVLLVAALGLVGTGLTLLGDYLNARQEQATAVILKASDVPMSLPPEQQKAMRANNLLWFADAGYIDLDGAVRATLRTDANLKEGEKPQMPVIQASTPAGSAAPHYDFPSANRAAVDPRGWTVDIFSCAREGAQYEAAQRLITRLAALADGKTPLGGTALGAIRYDSGQRWRSSDEIWHDPAERALASALQREARAATGKALRLVPNSEAPTPSYLSIYFCGPA